MSDLTRDRQVIRRKLGLDPEPAILADADGVVYEPGRPGFYRVRRAAGLDSSGVQRFTQPASLRLKLGISLTIKPGAALWLNYDENDELVIIGGNGLAQEQQGINQIQQNPLDPYAYQSINQADILTLAANSTSPPSTQVYLKAWPVYNAGTLSVFPGGLTGTLDEWIPGVGYHNALAIGIESDYATFQYGTSTQQPTTDPLDITDYREAIGSLTSTTTPAWIYRLHDDQTQILDADRWLDMRQMVNTQNGVAGGSGITQLIGDVLAGPGNGLQVATLPTVNSNVGTYNYATVTVNAKGLVTAAIDNSTPIAIITQAFQAAQAAIDALQLQISQLADQVIALTSVDILMTQVFDLDPMATSNPLAVQVYS